MTKGTDASFRSKIGRFLREHPGFTLIVIFPTLLAGIYYTFFAANIYQSQSQFLIRSNSQSNVSTGLTSILQSAGIGSSSDNSYAVIAYLLSRDALSELEKNEDIRTVYNRPEGDFLTRFPNAVFGSSFERLFIHYQDWVTAEIDTTTGVTTLTVNAFRADDAQRIARSLLDLSEKLVNKLNERALTDGLAAAKHEVQRLEQEGLDIQAQITAFRNRELMLDPNAYSSAALERLSALEASLASARSQLDQLRKSTPKSPQIPSLKVQIDTLEQQVIDEERRDSAGNDSLAPKMAEYQRLVLKQQFNQQMLESTVASLETAEVAIEQQQVYIERVSEPNRQDIALLPTRGVDVFLVGFTCLLIYGIGRILLNVILEHLSG